MLQHFTITLPDGKTVERYAKYDREELDQMNAGQLMQVLSELKQFAHYCNSQIFDPIDRLEKECGTLTFEKIDTRQNVLKYGIALVACIGLLVLFRATHLFLLATFLIFVVIGGALIFALKLFKFVKASRVYSKRYPQANADLQQLYAKKDAEIFGTYLDNLVTGKAVLPDYFLNESALDFMISALQNHRATSFAQVVNLYEATKQMQTQNDLLSAQLAAQQSAARSAAQAAAAAERAASSASTVATNTIYNRKS